METLDKVLKSLVESNYDVFSDDTDPEKKDELVQALVTQKKECIIAEVREEFIDEFVCAANEKLKSQQTKEKIEAIQSTIFEGIMLAFIVGLAVNQVTDLIGILKGSFDSQLLTPTIIWSIAFIIISVVMCFSKFIKDAVELVESITKE